MTRDELLAEITDIFAIRADGHYGLSAITQKQHALQAAWLAERDGHPSAMIAAALMHDIGHMVHDLGHDPAAEGVDDEHERLGHDWLTVHFGPAVTEPVRLHVAAKRYLCGAEPDYFEKLSPDSVRSLALQGGPMSADEIAAFRAIPEWRDAVQLRRYDERAKVRGLETPSVEHFLPHVAACITD